MTIRWILVSLAVAAVGCGTDKGTGSVVPSGGADVVQSDGVTPMADGGGDGSGPGGVDAGPTDTGPGADDGTTMDTGADDGTTMDAGPGPGDGTMMDAGPGADDGTTMDAGPGADDGTMMDAGTGPDGTAEDAGPGDDGTMADAGPGPDDGGTPDTGTPTCADSPTCECFIGECAAGLGVPAATACGVLGGGDPCLAKLLASYQAGGCGEACGGTSKEIWAILCSDADCAPVKGALTGAGVLTTQCASCSSCVANCAGKSCGDDGCGGSCGTCDAGSTCDAGTCTSSGAVPATCDEAHGLPGCCANGDVFWFEGGVLQGGTGACGDQPCGWDTNNGYYACGFEGADPSGKYPLACFGTNPAPETCPACSCTGKACGDDGCGGSCGTCGGGDVCGVSGQCVPAGTLQCVVKNGCAAGDPCTCVSCATDGACTTDDDCVCPDCKTDSFCSNPSNCNDDGICDMFNEGCVCADCAAHPSCK